MTDISKETRRESYIAVLPRTAARQGDILTILQTGDMTAQEIADELHRCGIAPTDERNFAAPRLTELKKSGQVKAIGKKKCKSLFKISIAAVF